MFIDDEHLKKKEKSGVNLKFSGFFRSLALVWKGIEKFLKLLDPFGRPEYRAPTSGTKNSLDFTVPIINK